MIKIQQQLTRMIKSKKISLLNSKNYNTESSWRTQNVKIRTAARELKELKYEELII